MAPMQRLGTRVAMLAAVGIMLAGCSGGGGTTPATGGMGGTPDPGAGGGMEQPGAGAAAARADFFPISGAVLANGARAYTEEEVRAARVNPEDVPDSSIIVSQGSTFQNLVPQPWIDRNFIQFSDFEFGAATDNDGIMLSKASAQQANRYNAIAYQGVLEHSMFLFQGGIYNYPLSAGNSAGQIGSLSFSIGTPSQGAVIAGTWEGIAVAVEHDSETIPRTSPPMTYGISGATADAERRIVRGDVRIGVTIPSGGSPNVSFEFSNWQGGTVDYPDGPTSEERTGVVFDGLEFSATNLRPSSGPWGISAIFGHFYGPEQQEVGGTFGAEHTGSGKTLAGVFGAKKQ